MSKPDANANSHAGQHQGFEVFWGSNEEFGSKHDFMEQYEPGWYWWSCQPGCLPDGEPSGPFMTSLEAHDDAYEPYSATWEL